MTVGRDKKIILLSGSGDTVAWFRLDFLNEFLLRSYKVYVLAPDIRDDLKPELINMGIEFIEIKLERKGFNVLNLISSVFELVRLFKEIQPNIIFSYTHKAILSGSLAAKISGFSNTFSMVTGTGHLFDNQTKKEKVIKSLKISVREVNDNDISTRNLNKNTKGVVITNIENKSPLVSVLSVNDIIIEVQKNPVKNSSDLKNIVDGIFKKAEKTLLLTVIDQNNRRRYLGVKIN